MVNKDNPIPPSPFWGSKCLGHIPLRSIVPYINKTTLYKFQWGYKAQGRSPEDYRQWARLELDPLLNRLVARSEQEQILMPQAVYGYYPCQSQENTLIVYEDTDGQIERCRFEFPRQSSGRHWCLADFFRSVESGEMDVVAFQLVTVGQHAADFARGLFAGDQYQDYLYWHGLNVEATEGLAEFVHRRVRSEWGFAQEDARVISEMIKQKYRGSRYSFGYPACPNLADQTKILELLGAERIHVEMGEEDQLWPEESTSAIIVHHPEAKYFSV